jgi:hypothetical protein
MWRGREVKGTREGGTAMVEALTRVTTQNSTPQIRWGKEKKEGKEDTREADTRACTQGFEMGEDCRLLHFRFCIIRVNDTMTAAVRGNDVLDGLTPIRVPCSLTASSKKKVS